MKLSPTMPLALALVAGIAVTAAAQTIPGTSDSKSTVSEPKSTVVKPMTGSTQTQPGMTGSTQTQPGMTGSTQTQQGLNDKLNDNKATSSAPMKSSATNGIEPKSKSSAEMKAMQPKAKRTAHLKATHPRRMTQTRTAQRTAMRTERLRPSITQAENLSPAQVKQAQARLHAAGLYNGPTDGLMDPDTRAALARFQQQNGLRRTETLDQQTLSRLNSGQTTTGFGSSVPSGNQAPPASAGGNTTGQPINH